LVGDGPGQVPIGELGTGDGFRLFRTKGDDGGRHRRRRQVNRVFTSWRFDRPDFLDLESHSGCRASGPDGRYFPPTEVTPLIVVLQRPLIRRTLVVVGGSGRSDSAGRPSASCWIGTCIAAVVGAAGRDIACSTAGAGSAVGISAAVAVVVGIVYGSFKTFQHRIGHVHMLMMMDVHVAVQSVGPAKRPAARRVRTLDVRRHRLALGGRAGRDQGTTA